MKALTGQLAVEQFDAADFDDAIAGAEIESGGFRIEYNFSHSSAPFTRYRCRGAPSASARSFSTWPAWPLTQRHSMRWRRQPIQFPPQLGVLHRLLVSGAPAAPFPGVDPLADALLHILRIGMHARMHRTLEGLQGADHGGQFHAVVGGRPRRRTVPFRGVHPQDGTPHPPGPGLPLQAPSVYISTISLPAHWPSFWILSRQAPGPWRAPCGHARSA
jgi:hypothetical protein